MILRHEPWELRCATAANSSKTCAAIRERSGSPAAASTTSPPTRYFGGRYDRSRSSTISRLKPEHREVMIHEDGARRRSFMIPRCHADLVKRREAIRIWADATFGMVGRSPDYLNTLLMTWAEGAEFFGQRGARSPHNVRDYYEYCRGRDLFLTHAIVNPQTDRSKGSHQQERRIRSSRRGRGNQRRPDRPRREDARDPRADRRRAPGLSAARQSARARRNTSSPSASLPRAKGCASSAASRSTTAAQSLFDHPLGARFEEPDAVCVFDDVLIPWDRVFLYDDVKMGNALFKQASSATTPATRPRCAGSPSASCMTGIASR